jgi:hypothetical protein
MGLVALEIEGKAVKLVNATLPEVQDVAAEPIEKNVIEWARATAPRRRWTALKCHLHAAARPE